VDADLTHKAALELEYQTLVERRAELRDRVAAASAASAASAADGEAAAMARLTTSQYAGVKLCQRCGAHTHRSEMVHCSDCHRDFCGRGGRGINQSLVALPCVEVYRCNCGGLQCHDCYMGAAARGCGLWRHCLVCGSMMCPKEWEGRGSECRDCGAEPMCKPCRPEHDRMCPGPPPSSDGSNDDGSD
jgi:hypothetical protein